MRRGFLLDDASSRNSDSNLGPLGDRRVQRSVWGSKKTEGSFLANWSRFKISSTDKDQPGKKSVEAVKDEKQINPYEGIPLIPANIDNPVGGLAEWYCSNHNGYEFRHDVCSTTWDDGSKAKMFTSIVTCPLSGERFASGRWGAEKTYEIRDELHEDGNTVKVVWYRKKKNAQHAAAARALDCLRARDATEGKIIARYGKDKPYLKPEDAPLLPTCPSPLFDLNRANEPDTSTPKNDLVALYKASYKKEFQLDNKCFVTWTDNNPYSPRFTSIFTCPLTYEHFASGQWINKSDECEIREEHLKGEKTINVVWYPSKKFAIQAAAARALDCFRYRLNQETGEIPLYNYGKEEPYLQPDDLLALPRCPCELPNLPMISFTSMFHQPSDKTEEMEVEEEEERLNLNTEYKRARRNPE